MKKSLMLLLIFTNCILSSCEKKSIKNDLEKENLKGNVVSITETNYKVTEKFGEPIKGEKNCFSTETCQIITRYNDFGDISKFAEYDSFGISFITVVKYNEKNQKTEQNRYTPNEGKRVMQFKLKYDLNGNCIEESSNAGYLVKREYDEDNILKKELLKDWQTKEFIETTYFYNEDNKLITEKYSQGKTEYTYYDDGNIKDVINYDKDGKEQNRGNYKYEYDVHKNWTAQIAYQNGEAVSYVERIIEYKN